MSQDSIYHFYLFEELSLSIVSALDIPLVIDNASLDGLEILPLRFDTCPELACKVRYLLRSLFFLNDVVAYCFELAG